MSFGISVKNFAISSKDFITTNSVKGYQAVKQFVIYGCRSIQSGWVNHVVPRVIRAWNFMQPCLAAIGNFMSTGYGVASIGITAVALLYILGQKYTNSSPNLRHAANVAALTVAIVSGYIAGAYGFCPIL